MKKSIILSTLALVSAFTFVGCNKEIAPDSAKETVVHFTINAAAPETKTYIEYDATAKTYTPNWHNGDALGVFFDSWAENGAVQATFSNTAANGPTATFEGEGTVSASEQTIYAFYPAGKFAKAYDNHILGITIPETQKPTATSFDKDADILVNKPYHITISSTNVTINDMQFSRLLSTLKLVLVDETGSSVLGSDNIKSVTITSDMTDAALTGRYQWDFVNESGAMNSTVKSASITADLSANPIALNGTNPIYLLVNPTTLTSGSNLVFNISTDKHEITKTAELPKDFVFPAGQVANLRIKIKDTDTIDEAITEPTGTGWYLVRDASWLNVGDKIIITNTTPDRALGDQSGTYRTDVTVSATNGLLNPGTATQLELATGATAGTFALKAGSKYLSHVDGKNQLIEADDITSISSWNIVVTSTSTSIQNSKNDGYYIMWNDNSSSHRFSCYTGTQQAIHIYKEYAGVDNRQTSTIVANSEEEIFVGQTKEIEYDVDPDGATVTLALGSGADGYVTVSGFNVTGVAATSGVPVVLSFAGDDDYKPTSENVTIKVHAVPEVTNFTQTKTGFSATLNEIIDGFTYSWVLYHGSVAAGNIVSNSNRTTSSTSIAATFSNDLTIDSFTNGDTYILVVTATKSSLSASSANVSFVAEDLDSIVEGANWVYTFTAKIWEEQGAQTLNGKSWTMAGTNMGSGSEYYNYDATKGQQFGSGNNAFSPLSLTSNFGGTYGVREIRVSTSGGSSIVGTVSVSVGGTAFLCASSETADLTSTNTTYAFVSPDGNLKAGDIQISYAQTSSKAIYIKKIIVNPAPATKLVMSDITCTDHSSSSVTFGWTAVTGAVDYEVSTDGTNYVSTNNTLSYTWGGRQPETNYTIWVKAIGDGDEYSTSDPKQSAIGTTDAASQGIPDPETFTMVSTNVATYTGSAGSVTFNKGGNNSNVPTWNTTDSAVRCYQKNTITVSAYNSNIASIVMTVKVRASSGKNPSLEITSGEGTIDPKTCTTSTTTITWTAGATDTDEVVFTLSSLAGNINFKSIEVTYK